MLENLEHGWIVNGYEDEYRGEIVGYCEDCCEPIYEGENYLMVDGVFICEDCRERQIEMEDSENES